MKNFKRARRSYDGKLTVSFVDFIKPREIQALHEMKKKLKTIASK